MASLHTTTELTKKIVIFAGLGVIILMILIFTFRVGKTIKNFFLPPGPPPPTATFGKIPAPQFPEDVTKEPLTYTLDTISGVLPTFPEQMKVYEVSHNEPRLLNIERAREKAGSIGFRENEQKIADEIYKWTDSSELKRSLTMNTRTLNFTMNSLYASYPPIVNGESVPDESGATETAKNFIGSMGLLPEDIDITKTEPELFTLKNGILTPATSLSTTQIIRVDFFQKDRDNFKMYYPRPPHSTMSFLIGGGGNSGTVVDAQFTHNTVIGDGSTYPIKTADEAFTELQEGKAYISSFFGTKRNVKIDDITLGYYFPDQKVDYLMPIIVFHGDNDFFAYISAIPENWLK